MRQTFLILFLFLVVLVGCPRLPPVSGCQPLSQRCQGDQPQVCSPTQRWHTVGDQLCSAVPGQMCQLNEGVASCVRGVFSEGVPPITSSTRTRVRWPEAFSPIRDACLRLRLAWAYGARDVGLFFLQTWSCATCAQGGGVS